MLKRNVKSCLLAILLAGGVIGGAGCRQDMHDNPRYEAYEDGSHRELPEGTVARGSLALNPAAPKLDASSKGQPAQPAQPAQPGMTPAPGSTPAPGAAPASTAASMPMPTGEDGFPFKITKEILDRGENRYNISCLPCHGRLGDGNGMIALRGIRRPPSYHDDRLRKAPTSYFYDVVTNGFGAMASYSDQLTPEDRWKVIAYIRVLQLSQRAEGGQLTEADKQKLDEAEQKAKEKAGEHSSSQNASSKTSGGHSN